MMLDLILHEFCITLLFSMRHFFCHIMDTMNIGVKNVDDISFLIAMMMIFCLNDADDDDDHHCIDNVYIKCC